MDMHIRILGLHYRLCLQIKKTINATNNTLYV